MGVFSRWFGIGLGASAARAVFREDASPMKASDDAVREDTEATISAAEARYAEEARRLQAEESRERAAKPRRRPA